MNYWEIVADHLGKDGKGIGEIAGFARLETHQMIKPIPRTDRKIVAIA